MIEIFRENLDGAIGFKISGKETNIDNDTQQSTPDRGIASLGKLKIPVPSPLH